MPDIPITTITIRRYLDDDGDDCVEVSVDPTEASLVEQLGLLRFAEDSVIRTAMGDEPGDEEDEE